MIKIFTLKYEDRLEGFNNEILEKFLSDKEMIKWEGKFFEKKGEFFWTVLVEYKFNAPEDKVDPGPPPKKKDESYKTELTEKDWPLFNRLREWRSETSKKEGVPPYIIFQNKQLAKISTLRPTSLNGLQQIDGIGNSRRGDLAGILSQAA